MKKRTGTRGTNKARDIKSAIAHLRNADPVLRKLIDRLPPPDRAWHSSSKPNHFRSLVAAIVSQQLSGKAADTIFKRFEALFGGAERFPRGKSSQATPTSRRSARTKFPTPQEVLLMSVAKMRSAGLSKMKVSFLKDLAAKVQDGTVNFRAMKRWSDDEVIEHLVAVKGIGRWTAEMFLMFSLGRDDVFSHGDLGLRNAMQKLYNLKVHPTLRQAERITSVWKPYRSLGSLYLWASVDNRPQRTTKK